MSLASFPLKFSDSVILRYIAKKKKRKEVHCLRVKKKQINSLKPSINNFKFLHFLHT